MTQTPSTPTRVAHSVEASTLAKLNRGPPLVIIGQNASRVCATSGEGNRNLTPEGRRRVKDCTSSTLGSDSRPHAGLRHHVCKPCAGKRKHTSKESEGRDRGSSGWGGQRSDLMTKVFREGPAQGYPERRVREAAPRQGDFGERSSSFRKAFKCPGSEWPLPRSLGASIITTRVFSEEGRRPPDPLQLLAAPSQAQRPQNVREAVAPKVGGGTR